MRQQAIRYTSLESRIQLYTPDINLGVFRVYSTFLTMIFSEMTLGEGREEEKTWGQVILEIEKRGCAHKEAKRVTSKEGEWSEECVFP